MGTRIIYCNARAEETICTCDDDDGMTSTAISASTYYRNRILVIKLRAKET